MMNQNNTLYYKFKSEKKLSTIVFETTDISIGDIKKIITKRRGMEKCPEPCELLIYDDKTNEEYKNDNIKINPLKKIIIQRVPSHKLHDPRFIPVLRNENQIKRKNEILQMQQMQMAQALNTQLINNQILNQNNQTMDITQNLSIPNKLTNTIYQNDNQDNNNILNEIKEKISDSHINKLFNCHQCGKLFNNPQLTDCCGETYCKICLSNRINCPNCLESNLKYYPNSKLKEIQEKIFKFLEDMKNAKKQVEDNIEAKNQMNNLTLSTISNQQTNYNKLNSTTLSFDPKSHIQNNPIKLEEVSFNTNTQTYNSPNINPHLNQNNNPILTTVNPHAKVFENSKFFIIKSSNSENIEISQRFNEWATTTTNQRKLVDAYQQGDVILIFSVNKSGGFQGYAIMTSFISDTKSPHWNNEGQVKLGGTFKIQWLSSCLLPLSKIKNINNPLNYGESVANSRDTTELPKETGVLLCNLCYEQEKNDLMYKSKPPCFDNDNLNAVIDIIKKSKEGNY